MRRVAFWVKKKAVIVMQTYDPQTAQGVLRHASSDITMDIYTHSRTRRSGRR